MPQRRALLTDAAPALIPFALLVTVGAADGGYFPQTWRWTALALLCLAGAVLVSRAQIAVGRLEWVTVMALSGFTAWLALSASWSGDARTSLLESERAVVYLAALLVMLLVAWRSSVAQVLGGVLGGVTLVSAYGLITHFSSERRLDPIEGTLLFEPLGYANALGIFAAIGVVLATAFASSLGNRAPRVAALGSLAVLLPTLYFTSSRGAWISLAAGLAVMAAFRVGRKAPLIVTALLAAAAGVLIVVVLLASPRQAVSSTLVGENRPYYWHVAWRDYEAHPVLGSGAGTYGGYWLLHRPIATGVRDAHSLYIETLAELGPLGLGLFLLALMLPLTAGVRSPPQPLVAGATGAYVAYLVHAGVDWDWEMPVVTLAGLLCGVALLLAAREERRARPLLGRARAGVLTAVLALAVLAIVRLRTGSSFPV